MSREQSAIMAGYEDHKGNAKRVESNPSVQEELAKIRSQMADAAGITKEDIVQMLLDAVSLAKLQADPKGIVAAAAELNRMLGFNAPVVKKTLKEVDKGDLKQALRDLGEDELYRLAYGKTIVGEAKRVEDKSGGSA